MLTPFGGAAHCSPSLCVMRASKWRLRRAGSSWFRIVPQTIPVGARVTEPADGSGRVARSSRYPTAWMPICGRPSHPVSVVGAVGCVVEVSVAAVAGQVPYPQTDGRAGEAEGLDPAVRHLLG